MNHTIVLKALVMILGWFLTIVGGYWVKAEEKDSHGPPIMLIISLIVLSAAVFL